MRKALFLLPAEGTGEKHGCVVMLFYAQPRAQSATLRTWNYAAEAVHGTRGG